MVPTNIEEGFRDQLGDEHVIDIKPKDSGSCWAITGGGRTFSFDGRFLQPAPWLAANPRLRIFPSCIVDLNEGFLVGTLRDGLFIFEKDGRPEAHLNSENGLPEDCRGRGSHGPGRGPLGCNAKEAGPSRRPAAVP